MAKVHLKYEPDLAHREKHRWEHDYAAIIRDESGDPIGKCPASLERAEAQQLLETGVRWWEGRSKRSPYPSRVFNVRDGVVYRAHRMGKGAYHGFPEVAQNIPPKVLAELKAIAERAGCLDEFNAWLERYASKEDADDPDMQRND